MKNLFKSWDIFLTEAKGPVPITLKAPATAIPWQWHRIDNKLVIFVGHRASTKDIIHGPINVNRSLYRAINTIKAGKSVRVMVLPKDKDNEYVRFEPL